MSKLLGLSQWPAGFENQHSIWGDEKVAKKSAVAHGVTSTSIGEDVKKNESPRFKAPKKTLSNETSDTIESPALPRFDSGGATIAEQDSDS